MKKAVPGTAFFAGWLTAGSTIDRIFDDWRAVVILAAEIAVCAAMFCIGHRAGYQKAVADWNMKKKGASWTRPKQ